MVPWWGRIAAKIVLSRLPIPYGIWKRLHLFEHGDMNRPAQAWDTFLMHARSGAVLDTTAAVPTFISKTGDFNVLELGPGDSLFSAVIASSLGASSTYLVDAGDFATKDMSAYADLDTFLRSKGQQTPLRGIPDSLPALLDTCRARYLTGGVHSLASLSADSVDFCFSNAVLEHIPKADFQQLARELFRILKSDGVCVHRVDLKDHLGGALNNLRFSEDRWEGPLFRNSGFYTNRIRFTDMVEIFKQAGFECALPRIARWNQLPTPRNKLNAAFKDLPGEDLLVSGFDIVLSRRTGQIA